MSTDADVHKVGLIPVTLMMLGNIMGSGAFPLPANLASTGRIVIYGQLVTTVGALALSMVYAKTSSLDSSSGGSYVYAHRCLDSFLDYQTGMLCWLACWIGSIAMAVIGVGYPSCLFPILKNPLVLTPACVVVLWISVLLNIVGPEMITHIQAVATVLALAPVVGIVVFGWFRFCGGACTAAWNVSSMDTFDTIQSTLNVTLWSFIGVESAFVVAGVIKNLKCDIPTITIGDMLIAAACYVLLTTAITSMIPNVALHVLVSPFGDATRMALGNTAGAIVSFCAAAGCLGSLGGWTLLVGQTARAVTDDGLFPPIFTRVNKVGTPVAGLIIVGILMTIFQFSSMSPNAAKGLGLVFSVSAVFTLVPCLYTCAALLLLDHGHSGRAYPMYLLVTFTTFVYCVWAVVDFDAKEVMWSLVMLMIITALYILNYNRIHKNPYPLGTLTNNN